MVTADFTGRIPEIEDVPLDASASFPVRLETVRDFLRTYLRMQDALKRTEADYGVARFVLSLLREPERENHPRH